MLIMFIFIICIIFIIFIIFIIINMILHIINIKEYMLDGGVIAGIEAGIFWCSIFWYIRLLNYIIFTG